MKLLTKKNTTIAGLLSLLLGPIGYFYIGLNFFISGIIISVLFSLVLSIINLPFPHFFSYLQLLVYCYFGYKLAVLRNAFIDDWGVTESDIKDFKSFGFSFVVMTNLLMALTKFYSFIVGLYLAYINFTNGKIFIGILIILFGIAIITWVLTSIFSFISGFLMLIFRVDKKYFEQ
ncbi:MAG: hypothetical protein M1480_08460 [Bacteroidetes bacterium]|nr:hypothetical protein [Bacteroidota bacterium]